MTNDVKAAIQLLLCCGYGVFRVPSELLPSVAAPAVTGDDEAEELAMGKQNYTVNEFCMMYGIGRTFFYDLLKQGAGPEIVKIGRKTMIPRQAAQTWHDCTRGLIHG